MAACMDQGLRDKPVLDFGAGTGWITEFVARMGWRVTAFDIHGDLEDCLHSRVAADSRIDGSLISFDHGDGHAMPFADASFGHILVYDTLHHMHDFERVFAEFARILVPGGRAIFVEPGAKHSKSSETVEFLKEMTHDSTWIDRDIILNDIDRIASLAGFSELTIVPDQHVIEAVRFPLSIWQIYRARTDEKLRAAMAAHLSEVNYNQRVIFFCENIGPERAREFAANLQKPRFSPSANAVADIGFAKSTGKDAMDTTSVPKCGTCAFWNVFKSNTKTHAQCRRFPPALISLSIRPARAAWPATAEDHWCGEWRQSDA